MPMEERKRISSKALLEENKSYGTQSDMESHKDNKDAESMEEKLPYPKSVFFIVVNEFCERFSYYGMKAILTLYLTNVLLYNEDKATVIYHAFSGFCYFTPLFGAMIADSLLGKFRTILYLSIVYATGNIILSLAATPPVHLPTETFTMIGLALIAIGTGGIKPCVSAFGGDQFKLPQQERQLSTFFSIFYFSINAGSLLSTWITPIFRKDVTCFGQDTCYSLAFFVPAVLMIVALLIFVIGKPWYTIRPVEGNVVVKVSKCIAHGLSRKRQSETTREHWLDHADDKYDKTLIDDIKVLMRILKLYIPLPVFWALFDQQGSRWTLQATRMDGEIFGFQMKPDQMQVVNPLLILALIPFFDQIVYPFFAKFNFLKKPLQRMTVGGVLAAAAFIISGILELKLDPTYAVKLAGKESHINFINTLPCNVSLTFNPNLETASILPFDNVLLKRIDSGSYDGNITIDSTTNVCKSYANADFKFEAEALKAYSFSIISDNGKIIVLKDKNPDELDKSKEGNPKIKMIINDLKEQTDQNASLLLQRLTKGEWVTHKVLNYQQNASQIFTTDPEEYKLVLFIPSNETINRIEESRPLNISIRPRLGGNYVLSLTAQSGSKTPMAFLSIVTAPNSLHMLWLLPQYIVITTAEILFSITGLEFSFSQAPASMKSVVQAAWLLTVAFGNVIVIIVAEYIKLGKQSSEFFLFSGLMIVDMLIFAVMAYFYTSGNSREEKPSTDIPLENSAIEKPNPAYHND